MPRLDGHERNLMTDITSLTRFTGGSIAGRQARLTAPLRDLHRAGLRRFLETGAAPTARWVRQTALDTGLDASAADELAAADAIHLSNGIVAVAYPFSGIPTPHRVQLDGLPPVYAMCAIYALGLPAMAGRDGQTTSTDPRDGTPVVVTVLALGELSPAHRFETGGRVLYPCRPGHPLPASQARAGRARHLRLPRHRRADRAHRPPGP